MLYNRLLQYCYAVPFRSKCKLINSHRLLSRNVRVYSNYSEKSTFSGEKDRFNGITVDTAQEKLEQQKFTKKLEGSLKTWREEGRRCIWFKVNIKDSACVPILAQFKQVGELRALPLHAGKSSFEKLVDGVKSLRRKTGWKFQDDFVMMYKWLPSDSKPNLPPASHTNLGVGAMVFNSKDQLLAVSEKHYDYPHWKLPGGYVERGEDIIDAALREVKEETGIESAFQSLVTFRHTHNMTFGNSDIYVLLMLKAVTESISISEREVTDCKWMDVEEYTNHPHVHAFNKLIVRKALEYKSKHLKLDIQKKTVKWSTFVREMNFLTVENFK